MSLIKQNNISNQLFKKKSSLLFYNQQQQLQRRMATIQANTDVRSAAYHFKQQKHMPYFLEYLMWVIFGSESLHLIWLKSEYNDYKDHIQYKIKLLTELIHLLETNSPVPESLRNEIRLLKLDEKHKQLYQDDVEDDYLDKLIASVEAAENTTKENMTTTDTILPMDNTPAIPAGSDQSSINGNNNNDNNNTTPNKKQKFII
ncbi:hypothetical protein BJ944DRAFT_228449 [Cunninghamella echinulata]|nr:hypothetical protein BJ944DRAFT_228449 [Cunninghamella echinulata]